MLQAIGAPSVDALISEIIPADIRSSRPLALPAALGIALSFISPDHMTTLFTHPMGRTMLVGAAVMQTVGYFWIRQVIKIEV